jgi:hypothetical protein
LVTIQTGQDICTPKSFGDDFACVGEFLRNIAGETVVLRNKANGDMVMISGEAILAEYNHGLHLIRVALGSSCVVLLFLDKGKLANFSVTLK